MLKHLEAVMSHVSTNMVVLTQCKMICIIWIIVVNIDNRIKILKWAYCHVHKGTVSIKVINIEIYTDTMILMTMSLWPHGVVVTASCLVYSCFRESSACLYIKVKWVALFAYFAYLYCKEYLMDICEMCSSVSGWSKKNMQIILSFSVTPLRK